VLQEIDAQHPLDPDRRAAIAWPRIERLDQLAQRRPRHYPLHLGKKDRAPCRLGVALKYRGRQRQLLHPQPICINPPRQRFYARIIAAGFCRGSLGGVAGHMVHHTFLGIFGGCMDGMYVHHLYSKWKKAITFELSTSSAFNSSGVHYPLSRQLLRDGAARPDA
jgi:hypothetical protein